MKSRRARSTQKETQKWAVGERKESLQWSLINFPFHPRSLGTRQSVKTVTTIVPQIRKVTTACQGCIEFIYLLNRFRNNFPLHESNVFDKWYVFLSTGHWTSMCPLEWELNTLILVLFTFEKSSTFPDWAPCRNHQHFIFVRSWTREQRVPGFGSLMWYCSCFLPFLLSFLTVNSYFFVSYAVTYMFLNFSTQWNSIGQRNWHWKAALESLFTFTLLIFRTKQGPWHLMKGSDFPPQDGNKLGPTYPCLAIFYWQSITFTRTVSQESHQTSPSALRAEKQVLSSNIIPWEPNLTHRQQLSLTEEESDFLPLLVFFSEWVQQSPTEHRIWR